MWVFLDTLDGDGLHIISPSLVQCIGSSENLGTYFCNLFGLELCIKYTLDISQITFLHEFLNAYKKETNKWTHLPK